MEQSPQAILSGWVNFYLIVGSAAGALTGLQFVVMTLIADAGATGSSREIRAFGTPTVMQFGVALLVSAAMTAPWQSVWQMGICLAIVALAGAAYAAGTVWHARKTDYVPDWEDWLWYVAFPLFDYAALLSAAVLLCWYPLPATFLIGATSLGFLFVGIRNSWDTVTYITLKRSEQSKSPAQPPNQVSP